MQEENIGLAHNNRVIEVKQDEDRDVNKPLAKEETFLKTSNNHVSVVLPNPRITLCKKLFDSDLYKNFPSRTRQLYWLLGHPPCRILSEKTQFIGFQDLSNKNNNSKVPIPMFRKSITCETEVHTFRTIAFPYTGTVRNFQVLECDGLGNALEQDYNEYEFIPQPYNKYKDGSTTCVSYHGVLTLGQALHPPPKEGGNLTYQSIRPLVRASVGMMYLEGNGGFAFKRPLSRQTAMVRIVFLTYISRDKDTNELLETQMPRNEFFVEQLPTPIGADVSRNALVYPEYWVMYVPVMAEVVLPLDAHGYEISVRYPDSDENLRGLSLRLHQTFDGAKLPNEMGYRIYEKGDTLHLLSHPLLLADGRFDPEDGNVSLAIYIRPSFQYDALKRHHAFRILLVPSKPHAFPEKVKIKFKQWWSDSAPCYLRMYPQYYDQTAINKK